MSNKRILKIGIASNEELQRRMLAIASGKFKPSPDEPKIWFESAEAFAGVFSKMNMMLLEIIRNEAPASVTELAELSGQERPNVQRAISILKNASVIELVDGEHGRKAPKAMYDDYSVRTYTSEAA